MSQETRPDDETGTTDGVRRRRVLQGLGATSIAGLAGCSYFNREGGSNTDTSGSEGANSAGDTDGDGGNQLGERVPEPIVYMYFTGMGQTTSNYETMSTVVMDNITETFDLEAERDGRETVAGITDAWDDTRDFHMWPITPTSNVLQFDVDSRLDSWHIANAGANGKRNHTNYASCETTELIEAQREASNPEERDELLREAQVSLSEDIGNVPLGNNLINSAARSDTVDVKRADSAAGLTPATPYPLIYSDSLEGDTISVSAPPRLFERLHYPLLTGNQLMVYWGMLVHSPLFELDQDYERQNILADSYEVEDDGQRITIELADAQFHNGDPITPADVKWTFEHLSNNADIYGSAIERPYDSIDVVDDTTIEFNFTEPHLVWINGCAARWGILHKETWVDGGADENPEEFTFDPQIGSGPFQVEEFQQNQYMILSPADQEHPVHNPDHNLELVKHDNKTTAVQALINNEIDILPGLGLGNIQTIETDLGDTADTFHTSGIWPHSLLVQHTVPPMTEREFRAALGACIDRTLINDLLNKSRIDHEFHASITSNFHPQRPSNDRLTKLADDPGGEPDRARQILEDAGWGWDDDGNLRYPADADISPPFPQGETPSSENGFPCITSDGEYTSGD